MFAAIGFSDWFDSIYRARDERRTTGIARLHLETGVSPMSIRRALAGTKVRSKVARRLSEAAGGVVTPEALTGAPASTIVPPDHAQSVRLDSAESARHSAPTVAVPS